jgi:hypothetical protein
MAVKKKYTKQMDSDANMAAIKRSGGMAEYKAAMKKAAPTSAYPKKQRKGVDADKKRLATSIKRAK